ncbi:MAG: DUF2061 domain-containing protein [Bacteroidales bacterium]
MQLAKTKHKNQQPDPVVKPVAEDVKESPGRSILKAISWRFIASATTFLVAFIIFRRYSDKTLHEVLETASFVTAIEFMAKIILYYLHERLWTNIKWGKYWRRQYWARRRWRKLYRKMHEQQNFN